MQLTVAWPPVIFKGKDGYLSWTSFSMSSEACAPPNGILTVSYDGQS